MKTSEYTSPPFDYQRAQEMFNYFYWVTMVFFEIFAQAKIIFFIKINKDFITKAEIEQTKNA